MENTRNQLMDNVINSMMALLWEHREHLYCNDGNVNAISYIDDDIDAIEIQYFNQEPDGDRQEELADEGHKMDFQEAFNLLHTRMINSGLFNK
jgi:hypothetical protein